MNASDPTQQERYDKIEELVFRYKAKKESEDLIALLKLFAPLFDKYYLLSTRKKNYWDKGATRFLSAVMYGVKLRDAHTKAYLKKFIDNVSVAYLYEGEEYVYSDLQYVFIFLLDKYEPQGTYFCAYVDRTFPYEFGRLVARKIDSPSVFNNLTLHSFEDYIDKKAFIQDPDERIDEFGYLTKKWATSEADIKAFEVLSESQKELFLLYYQDSYNDRQISELLNVHINTVNKNRMSGVRKLEEVFGVSHCRTRVSGEKNLSILKEKLKQKPIMGEAHMESIKNNTAHKEETIIEGKAEEVIVELLPLCASCFHVNVCKHKKRYQIIHQNLLSHISKDEMSERGFELRIDCENYANITTTFKNGTKKVI